MTWWCSATGQPWTGAWQAYPGVWLFVIGLAAALAIARRRLEVPAHRPTIWYPVTGLLAVWLALDWPIGALGSGYLASFHAMSYILLSLVAPPLLLLAIPPSRLRHWRSGAFGPALRFAARPPVALCAYTVVLLVTHVPDVVDPGMATQWGAMIIDLAWLAAGLWMWWPVVAPSPEYGTLSRPLKMLYLFLGSLPPIVPSAFLTFADYPIYAVYELAPRAFASFGAQQDQQVAGLIMKIVGDIPVWLAFGIQFFRWAREEHAGAPAPRHPAAR